MALLLCCLLIFLIHRVRNSQIHSALSISRRLSTYRWILYSHLSSMVSSTGSSTILDNMVLHQDLKSHHIFERILHMHRQGISPHLLLVGSIVMLFHHVDIHLAWLVIYFINKSMQIIKNCNQLTDVMCLLLQGRSRPRRFVRHRQE
jgi:hypothetical protein